LGCTISIETASDTWHLLRAYAELCDFATALVAKYPEQLPDPSSWRTKLGVKKVNKFFQKLVFACDEDRIPASEPLLQEFLRDPADTSGLPRRHLRIVCSSLRRVWVYPRRPYRHTWLRVLKAAHRDPQIRGTTFMATFDQAAAAATKAASTRKKAATGTKGVEKLSSLATTGGKYQGLPDHMLGVTVRPLPPTLLVRSTRPTDHYPVNGNTFSVVDETETVEAKDISAEIRSTATNLVNKELDAGPQKNCTFVAKRLFQGIQQKIDRASNERRVLSTMQRRGKSSSMPSLASTAPLEVRAIFHNGCSNHVDWPSEPPVPKWEGSHIDHTKLPGVKENPKLAYMTPAERAAQFNTYFHPPDLQAKKIEVLDHRRDILGPYHDYKLYEAREHIPARETTHGRVHFDPQVGSLPLANPGNISEIDNKPQEEFRRGQERLREKLDRAVPPGQKQHFLHGRTTSEMPLKWHTMALKEPEHDMLWDGKQHSMLGWGQTRACHYPTDYKTYARPLGNSDMDRRVSLGPLPLSSPNR